MNSKEYMTYCLMDEVAKQNLPKAAEIFFELFKPEEPEPIATFDVVEECFDFPNY